MAQPHFYTDQPLQLRRQKVHIDYEAGSGADADFERQMRQAGHGPKVHWNDSSSTTEEWLLWYNGYQIEWHKLGTSQGYSISRRLLHQTKKLKLEKRQMNELKQAKLGILYLFRRKIWNRLIWTVFGQFGWSFWPVSNFPPKSAQIDLFHFNCYHFFWLPPQTTL